MQKSHVLPRQQHAAGQTLLVHQHMGRERPPLQVADFSQLALVPIAGSALSGTGTA